MNVPRMLRSDGARAVVFIRLYSLLFLLGVGLRVRKREAEAR